MPGDRQEWGGKEPTYFLRARYVRAIEELGGVPVILPLLAVGPRAGGFFKGSMGSF